ncbi:MAG: hemolysin family protein [Gammaproteobacteria bacterium]|nr:hemolysin family protein [Gammaproteobacteria bacterium]MDH5777523.1 hemolysin family protein [Gammaproteobacteria bacterium]
MTLLITYVLIALLFSFLCSIAEAVILSISPAHIALLEKEQKPSGKMMRELKDDINKPLAAILTLNTITHTMGAAGAGAQAAIVFGNTYVGVASAVLTLLILIFSEIIPKTLGAHYWRGLAPVTAYGLRGLVWLLYPFVIVSEWLTRGLTHGPTLKGFSREEFAVMAELSEKEGELAQKETVILKNLLLLRDTQIRDAMTPRTVIFSLSEDLRIEEFFHKYDHIRFSRIPIYKNSKERIDGFVLRSDLLLAQARGNINNTLSNYARHLPALLESMSLSHAFDELMRERAHIVLVVDEYGEIAGILTLEDVLETLLGLEIIDEGDKTEDMQKLAQQLRRKRLKKLGLDLEETKGKSPE